MSRGLRIFLFEEDGTMRHVPIRVMDGLSLGYDRLPQYAGKRLRSATVVLDVDERIPIDVKYVYGQIFHFDGDGGLQRSLAASAMTALETSNTDIQASALGLESSTRGATVIDVSRKLKRARWERENRWEPTSAEITRMVHAIWPEQAGRPVARAKPVTGIKKRRIPMSYEAKNALSACAMPAYTIKGKIDDLDEKDLKSFIANARKHLDPSDPVSDEIWKGIIAAAEKQLEIRKVWKTGKGTWYAAVDKIVARQDERHPHIVDQVTLEFRECEGKATAVKAARELLALHAGQFDEGVEIETHIYPEILWSGPAIE